MAKEVILVKQIELAQAKVHLIGTSPLMVHKFSEKSKRAILDKQQKRVSGPKEIRNFAVGIGEYRIEKGGIFGGYCVAAGGESIQEEG